MLIPILWLTNKIYKEKGGEKEREMKEVKETRRTMKNKRQLTHTLRNEYIKERESHVCMYVCMCI